jgi:hypothetical protein
MNDLLETWFTSWIKHNFMFYKIIRMLLTQYLFLNLSKYIIFKLYDYLYAAWLS